MPAQYTWRRRAAAACAPLAALLLAGQLTVAAQGTNWASLANGASATSSGVGYARTRAPCTAPHRAWVASTRSA